MEWHVVLKKFDDAYFDLETGLCFYANNMGNVTRTGTEKS